MVLFILDASPHLPKTQFVTTRGALIALGAHDFVRDDEVMNPATGPTLSHQEPASFESGVERSHAAVSIGIKIARFAPAIGTKTETDPDMSD